MQRFLSILTAFFLTANCFAQPYKNVVLKGGGIRGIAYGGALKVLEEKGITKDIEKVGGTSVGAIAGLMVSLGYSAQEIEELLFGMNVAMFNDGRWFFIGGQHRFRRRYGWYRGQKLEEWLGRKIMEKAGDENTTFADLHKRALADKQFKDLYVTATNLSTQKLEVFSWETYPNMRLKTAIRASISVPLYYGAVFTDSAGNVVDKPGKEGRYNIYVDGGLLANYPITMFNTREDSGRISDYTLGLKLERPEQIEYNKAATGLAPYEIYSFRKYIAALYNVTIEQLNRGVSYEEEKKHSIYISTSNLSPKVRHITTEQKRELFNNGVTGANRFFEQKN